MRSIPLTLALFAAPLFPSLTLATDNTPPKMNGTWQIDIAKSQTDHRENITLDIQEVSNKLTLIRHVRQDGGKEVVSHFSCLTNGSQCEFDEAGHKARGSAWHDGATLFILKSGGPRADSSDEWQLQLSPDGKDLNVKHTELSPNDKTENRLFHRTS